MSVEIKPEEGRVDRTMGVLTPEQLQLSSEGELLTEVTYLTLLLRVTKTDGQELTVGMYTPWVSNESFVLPRGYNQP